MINQNSKKIKKNVIPAKAGIHKRKSWTPAFAGVTGAALVILAYLAITIAVTWPVILKPFSHIYSVYGDSLGTLWYLWWPAFAIKQGVSILNSPYSAAPFTDHISFLSADYFLALPFTLALGEVFTYNLFIWLSFVLAGFGTYLLVYYLTKNKWAALIAGVIYSFSPFHYVRAMGHWDLAQIQWIPFFLYFLIKFDNERRWRFLIYALLCAFLTLITSPYYGIFLPVVAVVYVLVKLILDKKWKKMTISVTLIVAGFLISIPFLRSIFGSLTRSPEELKIWSLNWWHYFIPSPDNPVIGGISRDFFLANVADNTNVTEKTAYIGFTALILAIVGLIYGIKKKRHQPLIIVSLVVILIVFLASLGTNFISLGLNYVIPFFRAPNRLVIFVQLMIAVLAGFGMHFIIVRASGASREQYNTSPPKRPSTSLRTFESKNNSNPWLLVTGYWLLILLILLETYNAQPNHIIPAQASTPAIEWIKNNLKEDDIILQMPMTNKDTNHNQSPETHYFQRLHQKKLANNLFYNRRQNTIPEEYQNLWENLNRNPMETLPKEETLRILKSLGVNYIIMFTKVPAEEAPYELPEMRNNPNVELLTEFHKDKIIYGDLRDEWQEAEVYKITR